jgi:diguanylate cyclase (GGDEF)-like protein
MSKREREEIALIIGHLEGALRGEVSQAPPHGTATPEIAALAERVGQLAATLTEAREYLADLAEGNLDRDPPTGNPLVAPMEKLCGRLRLLMWQTHQVAAGDYAHDVELPGEFSAALSRLIAALREKQMAEEKLIYVSNHDALTELYNRTYFTEEMARIERGRHFPVSIIVADVDGLKKINDTLGHLAGDRLLQSAAQVLRQAVRGDDILARIGGDEFAVILPGTGLTDAARVITRIREYEALALPFNGDCRLSISLGLATMTTRGKLTEVLKLADRRMYDDKLARKGAGACPSEGS